MYIKHEMCFWNIVNPPLFTIIHYSVHYWELKLCEYTRSQRGCAEQEKASVRHIESK